MNLIQSFKKSRLFLGNLFQQYLIDSKQDSAFASDLISANDPDCYICEQYRNLAIVLIRSEKFKDKKCFLVTSPQPRDGKSTTLANLGFVLASYYKKRVLLIDADLRRPSLHHFFKQKQGLGLYDLLKNGSTREQVTINITANLDLIKSGILPVAENNYLSSTDEFRSLLDSLRDQYDYILVDSPPILKVSDAGILGHAVEQVLLVVRAEATPSTLVSSAQELLTAQGCAASACILVNHHHQMDVYSYITNNHYRNYYSNFYKSYDNRQPNSSSN